MRQSNEPEDTPGARSGAAWTQELKASEPARHLDRIHVEDLRGIRPFAAGLDLSAAASEARRWVGSSRLRTWKRISRRPGIEEQRLGLAPEEVELLEIPVGCLWIRTRRAEAFERPAGFGLEIVHELLVVHFMDRPRQGAPSRTGSYLPK